MLCEYTSHSGTSYCPEEGETERLYQLLFTNHTPHLVNWEDIDTSLKQQSRTATNSVASDEEDEENNDSDEVSAPEEIDEEEDDESSGEEYIEEADTGPRTRKVSPSPCAFTPCTKLLPIQRYRARKLSPSVSHSPPPTTPPSGNRRAPAIKRKASAPDPSPKKRKTSENDDVDVSQEQPHEEEEVPGANADPTRKYCVGKLKSVLHPILEQYRQPPAETETEPDQVESLEAEVLSYATELEEQLYKTYGEIDRQGKYTAGQKYKYVCASLCAR